MGPHVVRCVSGEQHLFTPTSLVMSSPAVRGPENELTTDSGSHYLVLVPSARPQEAFVRVLGSVVTVGLASH